MARVLIADDSEPMRVALRTALAKEGCEICGEVSDGREAVLEAARLSPDVIILDLSMPQMNGIEAAKVISKNKPDSKMILCTVYPINDSLVSMAQGAGFQAVLGKCQANLLPNVIDILLHGGTVFGRTQ
jgi:DNA-binding NarL/FixJ family response regulator